MAKKRRKVVPASAVVRPKIPQALLFRMFVIGSLSVVGSAWAVYHYYFTPRVPLTRPAPPAPSEIPVELDPPG